MRKTAAVIMAGGMGTRMKSRIPKVIHQICGKPMLQCLLDILIKLKIHRVVLVTGPNGDLLNYLSFPGEIETVVQKKRLGTAHAVMQAEKKLGNFKGDILVLSGDAPLICVSTLKKLLQKHRTTGAALTLLTTTVDEPEGYGRVVRLPAGEITSIAEEKNAGTEQKKIKEINAGFYCFNSYGFFKTLRRIKRNRLTGEYYLPEIIPMFSREKKQIVSVQTDDPDEMVNINTRYQLTRANKIMQKRIQNQWMDKGVTILDPETTFIDYDVSLGQDTIVYPFTLIYGKTVIGEQCIIGPFAQIYHSRIGDSNEIIQSNIRNSTLASHIHVGPYAHIRDKTVLDSHVAVGNFVEMARSHIETGSRALHLSYIGDTHIRNDTNLGAGIITANFDGSKKNKTHIGKHVFLGSSTTIVAPNSIDDYTIIPAGTTLPTIKKRKK